jgi:hypothetical protein
MAPWQREGVAQVAQQGLRRAVRRRKDRGWHRLISKRRPILMHAVGGSETELLRRLSPGSAVQPSGELKNQLEGRARGVRILRTAPGRRPVHLVVAGGIDADRTGRVTTGQDEPVVVSGACGPVTGEEPFQHLVGGRTCFGRGVHDISDRRTCQEPRPDRPRTPAPDMRAARGRQSPAVVPGAMAVPGFAMQSVWRPPPLASCHSFVSADPFTSRWATVAPSQRSTTDCGRETRRGVGVGPAGRLETTPGGRREQRRGPAARPRRSIPTGRPA